MATGKEVGVGEGLGSEASPAPATRGMTAGPEEVLLGFAAGVKSGPPEVEVADGNPPERRLMGMLLEERVAVVVVLCGMANSVTVTVTTAGLLPLSGLEIPLAVLDVDDEVTVDEVAVDEVAVDEVAVDEVLVALSPEPVTPPSTPAAVSKPRTFLSVVQMRDVPAVWMLGMAKHSRPAGHCSEVWNLPDTHFAMLPLTQAVSSP